MLSYTQFLVNIAQAFSGESVNRRVLITTLYMNRQPEVRKCNTFSQKSRRNFYPPPLLFKPLFFRRLSVDLFV